jgi:hypothetical protein
MTNCRQIKTFVCLSIMVLFTTMFQPVGQASQVDMSVQDRAFHRRAVEAVIWAMPLMNASGMRRAYRDAGVNNNEVGYYGTIQDWKFQAATPNNTTPYIGAFWNLEKGPMVVEIPASTDDVAIFGALMDFWQRPLTDVGVSGHDKGKGAKYVILPHNYDGTYPAGYIPVKLRTNNGWTILRPIIKDSSEENIKKVESIAKQMKIYPLSEAANPPPTKHVDTAGVLMNAIPPFDSSFFELLHQIIQQEVIDPKDMAMMGMLKNIGIEKGKPYQVDDKHKALLDSAVKEGREYMISRYHEGMIPFFYEGKQWSLIVNAPVVWSGFSLEFDNHVDYDSRGTIYYAITTSVKN